MHMHHFLIFFLLPQAFSSPTTTRPGCPARCGSLSIPFPFGVGPECSDGPSFDITCNSSTDPPKAYLSILNLNTEIVEVKLNVSQVRVKYPNLGSACYNLSDYQRGINKTEGTSISIDLTATPYTLSDSNWLTAIGCDDMVTALGQTDGMSYGSACVSFSTDRDSGAGVGSCPDDRNGYLPGNCCCQTPIPKDSHGNWGKSKRFPCSFAFIGNKNESGFSYPLHYLDNSTTFLNANLTATSMSALVLDWTIGKENCSLAKQNATTFACHENSECMDANVGGYFCRCLIGYEGTPYLTHGCQDIDECQSRDTNSCEDVSMCMNVVGSYDCSCPRGYFGDGLKDGRGLGSGMGFLLLLSFFIWLYKALEKEKNKKQKEKFFKRNGGLLFQQQTSNGGTLGENKHFSAKELEKATDHYNENRILGQGGQGTVYKGMLVDGKIVAIKKSNLVDENQLEQFINEVVILSQINHRNIVKLLGCCLETEVPMLVYEFLPNGTLFDLIHEANIEFPFSWDMRLKIATDIAGALAYLHSASSIPVYHRDIKSSNILLDEKYVVKVSDFETSRSIAVDQTHLTTLVKGTFGYLDPEYFQSSQFTEKSDVYSFGVVIVELLTGKRAISLVRTEEERSLATRFLVSMKENSLDTILDPQVSQQVRNEEVIVVARLAQRCLNLKGRRRPTMKEVATELESLRFSQMIVEDESNSRLLEANSMISDIEYTWTNCGNSVTSTPSDTHPLIFETV
ncbi:hypothetical protein C2S51_003137 [Perilla frutescens var. frutescens]|nr:hypothetical protein C2S51_003137 [Perilla frutescens var. frutescens]